MLTVNKLKTYGADVESGLARCMNNEAFYLKMVNMAAEDAGFERLKAAVESKEIPRIFEAAHALKGMLGNLALTPLFQPASEMTELARTGSDADYASLCDGIFDRLQELQALRDES